MAWRHISRGPWTRGSNSPQIVLLDRPNRIDGSNIRLDTQDLQPQTGSLLNDLVRMVCVLRRDRIGLPFDIRRDVLRDVSQSIQHINQVTYFPRNKHG